MTDEHTQIGRARLTGSELRDVRTRLGMSQLQLSLLCDVARGTISDWEREKFVVPLLVSRVLRMIAANPARLWEVWPEAMPLIAPRPVAPAGEVPAALQEPPASTQDMLERWADDDGAGVVVSTPGGATKVLGQGKEKPVQGLDAASRAKQDALAAEVARRLKKGKAAAAKSGRRKR
jgi:transcriptional regulator with XRE-family HTH domain